MRVRLLGSAAGGGFPQWNCNCPNCSKVRSGIAGARPRMQSSVALSAEGEYWFLLNASPDVRAQIESFEPLLPSKGVRGTGVAGILLTNADLDHTLGLLLLREGECLIVHATSAVRRALTDNLRLEEILSSYGGVIWREPPAELTPLLTGDGAPSGLRYAAFPVPGKLPRYREGSAVASPGDTIGYCFEDEKTNGRLVFVPNAAALTESVRGYLSGCDAFLLDGTFWSDREMQAVGAGTLGAREMGHLPIGDADGSLAYIGDLNVPLKIYLHINNTNPILCEGSPERQLIEAAGAIVGYDGQEFTL
jgi:pyrroloquinoline quinone biosynthesis protein B